MLCSLITGSHRRVFAADKAEGNTHEIQAKQGNRIERFNRFGRGSWRIERSSAVRTTIDLRLLYTLSILR